MIWKKIIYVYSVMFRRSFLYLFVSSLAFVSGIALLHGEGSKDSPFDFKLQNASLEKLILEKGRRITLNVGDLVPNFSLINQDGEWLGLKDLRGHPFVLNFIFTRCTASKMCPASTQRMAKLQKEAARSGLDALRFVTISFDPEFDTPEILRNYAKIYAIELHNFDFLTYDEVGFIDSLLHLFGILTRQENGTIDHTISTFLIDREGRIVLKQNGPNWSAERILKAVTEISLTAPIVP